MNAKLVIALSVLVFASFIGCSPSAAPPADQPATAAPDSAPAPAEPGAQPPELPKIPDDEGMALLDKNCTKCHDLERVKGFDGHEPWQEVVNRMITKHGAFLAPEDTNKVLQYLIANYPPKA